MKRLFLFLLVIPMIVGCSNLDSDEEDGRGRVYDIFFSTTAEDPYNNRLWTYEIGGEGGDFTVWACYYLTVKKDKPMSSDLTIIPERLPDGHITFTSTRINNTALSYDFHVEPNATGGYVGAVIELVDTVGFNKPGTPGGSYGWGRFKILQASK